MTFSLHTTTFFGPFRVHPRPAGDFAVDRFNPHKRATERWGLYDTESEARTACEMANRELLKLEKHAA